jgi:hypothetical protein
MDCYSDEGGCFCYYCSNCDKYIFKKLGCNSRLCSSCGKRYTDQWSNSLSKSMFNVPHRHIVLSVPDKLWSFLEDWDNRKCYMNTAIIALNDYFSKKLRRNVNVGIIVVLHPFGKDMKFQPHLHLLITEGAFDKLGKFHPCVYIPAEGFRKTWKYHILKTFQEKGLSNKLGSLLHYGYPNGFYVWVHKRGRITNPKQISKYVGRYIRHPSIANSRIEKYDGNHVYFYYINNNDEKINVKMNVFDFITSLIKHIPPKQFKMVRYYGAYARINKRRYGFSASHSSICQKKLKDFGFKTLQLCPKCNNPLIYLGYSKKGPPEKYINQKTLKKYLV